MSRREATIKAVAGALGPKSLDLTQFVRRSSRDRGAGVGGRVIKVRGEDAAGALAFAAKNRVVNDEQTYGDDLAVILLRLKYVDQHSRELLTEAKKTLVYRYSGLTRPPSETMSIVALAAIFEWVHDACPKCRARRAGVIQPQPCPTCRPPKVAPQSGILGRRDVLEFTKADGSRVSRAVAVMGPASGCPKCKGLGRIFVAAPRTKGVKCVACKSSGRLEFKRKLRWSMVNDYLLTQGGRGVGLDVFNSHWLIRFYRFLEVLRATDRHIVNGVDFGFRPSKNRATEPFEQEEDPVATAPPTDDSEDVQGELPPKFLREPAT